MEEQNYRSMSVEQLVSKLDEAVPVSVGRENLAIDWCDIWRIVKPILESLIDKAPEPWRTVLKILIRLIDGLCPQGAAGTV
jgi:hypothetical protein